MDNTALFKLGYGVYVITTKAGKKANGCITNTCMQVAGDPTRIAIAVLNTNYTCELIDVGGYFAVSILDESVTFDTIKYWGYRSGRDADKMAGLNLPKDKNGIPYVEREATAVLSATVTECLDLGSHTLFIAEVTDAKVLSDRRPITYAEYLKNVKPPAEEATQKRKLVGWKCNICGYEYEGADLPADFLCPVCGHPAEDFSPVFE